MKIKQVFLTMTFIFTVQSFSSAQTADFSKVLEETQAVARKTAYQFNFEFTYDWKSTIEKKDKSIYSNIIESVCSKKRCEVILVAENGKSFSADKIKKNREKAAKRLEKAEANPELPYHAAKEVPRGFGFAIFTNFYNKNSYFSSNLYLKYCQTDFVERNSIENRPTIKVRAVNCSVDKDDNKDSILFMPKTEALIWIDEKDKAVAKIEIYAKKEFENASAPGRPLVVMETARVPEGFWFWKHITVEATGNSYFFPDNYGNSQIEFYNYKHYTVEVDKVEIDKKQ